MKSKQFILINFIIILNLGCYFCSFAQDTSKSNFVSAVWISSFQMKELNQIKSCKIKSIKEYKFIDSNSKRKLTPTSFQYFDQSGKISLEQNFNDFGDEVPYSIIYNWLSDSNVMAYVRYKKKYKNFLNSSFDPYYASEKGYYSMIKSYNNDSNEIKVYVSFGSNYSIQKWVIFDSIDQPSIVILNEPLDIEPTNAINSSNSDSSYSNNLKTEFIYNDKKQLISILNGSFESLFTYAKIDL